MRRAQPITPDERQELAELVAFAENPANFYRPPTDWSPADRPAYSRAVGPYRVVFCIKDEGGRPHRHLSITGPGPTSPHQFTALTIASLVGFTGGAHVPDPQGSGEITVAPGSEWHLEANDAAHIVVIAQRLPAE